MIMCVTRFYLFFSLCTFFAFFLSCSSGIHIPELSVSLVTARGEAIDESEVQMTQVPESSTPLSSKKGKSLKIKGSSKSSRKTLATSASPSSEPAQGATAGTPPPAGRIEALTLVERDIF